MTNGQSSRVIAASGTDRRIRLRRPAPAGTPPTAPGRQTPAAADRPRHGRRLRPRQTNPGRSRQTPAAADRPRPHNKVPRLQKNAACRTGLPLRRSAVAGACHCSNQPPPPSIVTQACHYSNRTSLKPAVAQAGRRSSRAPSRSATQSDRCPTCCHPIRSQPRPAAARPLSTQKNAASPTGRGIPGCRHRLPYSHSIVAGGLEEMS